MAKCSDYKVESDNVYIDHYLVSFSDRLTAQRVAECDHVAMLPVRSSMCAAIGPIERLLTLYQKTRWTSNGSGFLAALSVGAGSGSQGATQWLLMCCHGYRVFPLCVCVCVCVCSC